MAMSTQRLVVDDPYTAETVFEAPLASDAEVDAAINKAAAAQKAWAEVSVADRVKVITKFTEAFAAKADTYALQISHSMGKTVGQAHGEIRGMIDRALQMASLAEKALSPIILPEAEGLERWIAREPVGVVAVLAAWNYPLLIAINPVAASVLAGNAVVLKHSSRTPQCAEQIAEAFETAGVPEGLITVVHADHPTTERLVQHPGIGFVSFTGSVGGGRRIYAAVAQKRFIDVTLELGGKDPAYVREDADFDFTADNVLDGAFFNAGQSCCGIERVYVHESLYGRFCDAAVAFAEGIKLGDPRAEGTGQGPMAQPNSPGFLQKQVEDARAMGARVLTGGSALKHEGKGRFFAPTVVVDTDHAMAIASEESFGPVIAIQKVGGDDEAIERMNDSNLGLTASVWTQDVDRGRVLLPRLQAGTVFLNRADYLDPMLAWTGVKDTGKGVSLSELGIQAVTRPKSYHLRLKTS